MNGALRTGVLALVLGLPPLLVQSAAPVPRLDADAVEYFAHLRSLYYDRDVSFENEFAHFGILERWDKVRPTATGLRRTNFSVGPALLWLPFYAAADVWARAAGTAADGYSAAHIRAVCLGSLVYGVAGLLLVGRALGRRVSWPVAFWTAFVLLYGTFLFWYVVHEPVMSHAGSFFLAALALLLWLERGDRLAAGRAAALGLTLGLATCVRWQNALLMIVPALGLGLDWARRRRTDPGSLRGLSIGAGVLGAAFFVAVLPQLLVFQSIFGVYLLPYPVQGRDYVRLDRPALLETFFSSRHGLLYWTPVLWAGFLGLLALVRREPRTGGVLLLAVGSMAYVNACSEDWWAGGSYSNRRFDSVLPILGLGMAACLDAIADAVRRRPGLVAVGAGVVLAGWNFLFMEQYRRNAIPRDDTVSFAQVARNNADIVGEIAGTPVAWPANWVFARRHRMAADRYDLAVGKYLFLRQNNLGGVIDLGDDRADPALLAEGWAGREPCAGAVCRRVESQARVLAPLGGDAPDTMDLSVRAAGSGTLSIAVNGGWVADFPLAAALQDLSVRVPAWTWRPGMNEVALAADDALVDKLVFERAPASTFR